MVVFCFASLLICCDFCTLACVARAKPRPPSPLLTNLCYLLRPHFGACVGRLYARLNLFTVGLAAFAVVDAPNQK